MMNSASRVHAWESLWLVESRVSSRQGGQGGLLHLQRTCAANVAFTHAMLPVPPTLPRLIDGWPIRLAVFLFSLPIGMQEQTPPLPPLPSLPSLRRTTSPRHSPQMSPRGSQTSSRPVVASRRWQVHCCNDRCSCGNDELLHRAAGGVFLPGYRGSSSSCPSRATGCP